MPKNGESRAYGRRYWTLRNRLLANKPACHWCGNPATTADHVPPIKEVGYIHYNLVPACIPCNMGHRNRDAKRTARPSKDW